MFQYVFLAIDSVNFFLAFFFFFFWPFQVYIGESNRTIEVNPHRVRHSIRPLEIIFLNHISASSEMAWIFILFTQVHLPYVWFNLFSC